MITKIIVILKFCTVIVMKGGCKHDSAIAVNFKQN